MKKIKLKNKTRVIFVDHNAVVQKVLLCDTHAEALNILRLTQDVDASVRVHIYDGDANVGDFFTGGVV